MEKFIKKLEEIKVGKEVITLTSDETNKASLEVIKNYGDVEFTLLYEFVATDDGMECESSTLVNGVSVGSGALVEDFNMKDYTKTMNAGICSIQSKNAIKWTSKVYGILDPIIDELIENEMEKVYIATENEDFQEELELEALEEELNEGEEDNEEDLDEDEYDALDDLLGF